jgi:hypothetical protein
MNSSPLPRLRVSTNHRFLVTEAGEPFFWLGDTAWELFHRLDRNDARRYFENRAEKRFTIIQAVILAEHGGLSVPNAYGNLPLYDLDPTRPNQAYFDLVDEYIGMAANFGLYIGLLPTWGDKTNPIWGEGPAIFNEDNAYRYGRWLGERYREDTNLVWILGGDRPAIHEGKDYRPIWRQMAKGIREGVADQALITYHPMGGHSTSEWLQEEEWLDMHMMQSGHGAGHDVPVWEMIAHDYSLTPTRPTLDGEPNYEDHPVSPWPRWDPALGYYRDHDVRKQIYRSVFAGGCGVTYGHQSIWQFYSPERKPITFPDRIWLEALDRPAACQVRYLRSLMESRPFLARIPDQGLLVSPAREGGKHVQATRDNEGSYALIYLPEPLEVKVNLGCLATQRLSCWWYDPRTGEAIETGEIHGGGIYNFKPPARGPDWVLVLDDITKGYPAPGSSTI